MGVVLSSSGTQAAVITTEHQLVSLNVAGVYRLMVDLVNMAAGDVLELRAKQMTIAGGTTRVVQMQPYNDAQSADALISISPDIRNALTDAGAVIFTLKQTAGTGRNFPWSVVRTDIEDVASIQSGLATSAALATVQADTDDIQSRLPAALVSGRIDASAGAIAANAITATSIATDAITAAKIATDAIGASELAADAVTEIAAGVGSGVAASLLATTLTESYAADGVAPTFQQSLWMLMSKLGIFRRNVTTLTMTSYKLDKTTAAMTHTLDSSTSPTDENRAT